MKSIDQLLEHPAKGCEGVADLYSWTLNYEPGRGPFSLFLDLIGWSADNIGEAVYAVVYAATMGAMGLGFEECSRLGAALVEYSDRPFEVHAYVTDLLHAEMEA